MQEILIGITVGIIGSLIYNLFIKQYNKRKTNKENLVINLDNKNSEVSKEKVNQLIEGSKMIFGDSNITISGSTGNDITQFKIKMDETDLNRYYNYLDSTNNEKYRAYFDSEHFRMVLIGTEDRVTYDLRSQQIVQNEGLNESQIEFCTKVFTRNRDDFIKILKRENRY